MGDIEKIKKLRILSGAGFKDCSIALDESKDDLDKAIEILRIKGISKASKKMSRSANEGVIAITGDNMTCLLYTSPSPRDVEESRMPSSA